MQTKGFPPLPDIGFIRAEHFRYLLGGLSRSTFFDAIRAGKLPKPVKLVGQRASGWEVGEVRETLAKIAASGTSESNVGAR